MVMEDTPVTPWKRGLICFSASVVISSGEYRSLLRAIQRMGSASESCLEMMGSRMSRGSVPRTRETRSRTS